MFYQINSPGRSTSRPGNMAVFSSFLKFSGLILLNFRATRFPKQILVDGLYAIYLKHWLTVFKRDKMLVIDGNDLCESISVEI